MLFRGHNRVSIHIKPIDVYQYVKPYPGSQMLSMPYLVFMGETGMVVFYLLNFYNEYDIRKQ